jgi:hypothetical protein
LTEMNRNRLITFCTFFIAIIFITSCSMAPHPNEKIIVGTWIPVSVEKVVDSSALLANAAMSGDTTQRKSKTGGGAGGDGGAAKKEAALDRLVKSETRATMEILDNHTAIKNFPGKPIHATWKMKGKGTKIVAKNVENKMKFVIEILEINKERIVVIEHAPVGDIKIVYERKM